jgi:hypothetical protein
MSGPKKSQPPVWPLPSTPSKPVAPEKSGKAAAGRVVHDARGNAVWNWDRTSGTDSTTHLLRKLDSPELALADDAQAQPPASADPGIDPYSKRNGERKPSAPGPKPKADAEPPAAKDSVLRQLLGKR